MDSSPRQQQQQQMKKTNNAHHQRNSTTSTSQSKSGKATTSATSTSKQQHHQGPPPEKWVVVIRNVENDFALVHQHAVERYCCLDHACDVSNRNASAAPSLVQYEIKARTETRTAEVTIFAREEDVAAAADSKEPINVQPIWLPIAPLAPKDSEVNKNPEPAGEEEEATPIPPADIPTTTTTTTTQPSAAQQGRFSSIGDMISIMKHKPYFTHPPRFMLGSTTADASDVDVDKARASRKRPRGGDEATAAAAAEEEEDNSTSEHVPILRNVRQAAMVTAELASSAHTTTKNLKRVLSDIPGFVSCWLRYPQHFRAVFVDEEALFRAKTLLDQFEAEGLRLSISLPDVLSRKYAEESRREGEANDVL